MSEVRIIKKYQNRCLYDTSQSKYISLSDLKQLVFDGKPFEVREVKTEKEITRQVLLQIIAEEENEGRPLFTTDVLMRFIRMYGDSVEDAFSSYMEQSMGFFDQQTSRFLEQFSDKKEANPMGALADITRRNMDLWQEAQTNFFRTGSSSVKRDNGKQEEKEKKGKNGKK